VPHRPEWLALHDEPALLPDLPIVDAHHHLWSRGHERYLLEDFKADLDDGHRIVATVHVQCGSHYRTSGPARMAPVGETEFASGVARQALDQGGTTQVCAGIVGYADLREEAVEDVLHAHAAVDAQRFKGIRQATAWDADPRLVNPMMKTSEGLYLDPAFRRGFARLAPLGLSFDAWALHPQLPEVVSLARAFPDTAIVVNHIGAPVGEGRFAGCSADVRTQWHQGIAALAECPNVFMKLGGLGLPILGMGFARGDRPLDSMKLAEQMRPWLELLYRGFRSKPLHVRKQFSGGPLFVSLQDLLERVQAHGAGLYRPRTRHAFS
jgi:predicted TIM-barrel fold metal-dependent hydrolase